MAPVLDIRLEFEYGQEFVNCELTTLFADVSSHMA